MVKVSRATLAQWEVGRHLPSVENARLLDDYLRAAGALAALADAARSSLRPRAPATAGVLPRAKTQSLADVFRRVGQAMVTHLIRDPDGAPSGWRHNLQQGEPQTALSTAYGIKTMLMLDEPYIDLRALEQSIRSMEVPRGGWASRSQVSSRPEVNAVVIDALFRLGTDIPVERAMSMLEQSVDDVGRARPFVLTSVLHTVLRLRPASPFADRLVEGLLATRRVFDGVPLWPEKVEPDLASLVEPSVAHTARAVVALQAARTTRRPELAEALSTATRWLVEQDRDGGVSEDLDRTDVTGAAANVTIRHFTSAWVAQALAGSEEPPVARITRALQTVWSRYDPTEGLWAWGNGDLPIWMTHDSVAALRSTALALHNTPIERPPGDTR